MSEGNQQNQQGQQVGGAQDSVGQVTDQAGAGCPAGGALDQASEIQGPEPVDSGLMDRTSRLRGRWGRYR